MFNCCLVRFKGPHWAHYVEIHIANNFIVGRLGELPLYAAMRPYLNVLIWSHQIGSADRTANTDDISIGVLEHKSVNRRNPNSALTELHLGFFKNAQCRIRNSAL